MVNLFAKIGTCYIVWVKRKTSSLFGLVEKYPTIDEYAKRTIKSLGGCNTGCD